MDAATSSDVVGVGLAGAAKNVAALAALTAAPLGPNASGSAAGKVFAEVEALARHEGARPATFAGLAGAGDLVATVLAQGSRNRRAGELLGLGMPAHDIGGALGQVAEAVTSVPLLAARAQAAGLDAPVLAGLATVIAGECPAQAWSAGLTAPPRRAAKARAA
jgi:glycerol-3-phosphate dehydrogenase